MNYWLCVLLAAAATAALPAAALAQVSGPRASPGLQQPQLRDDEQILPSQIVRPPPAPVKPKVVAKPAAPKPVPVTAQPEPDENPAPVAKPAAPPKPAEPEKRKPDFIVRGKVRDDAWVSIGAAWSAQLKGRRHGLLTQDQHLPGQLVG